MEGFSEERTFIEERTFVRRIEFDIKRQGLGKGLAGRGTARARARGLERREQ